MLKNATVCLSLQTLVMHAPQNITLKIARLTMNLQNWTLLDDAVAL